MKIKRFHVLATAAVVLTSAASLSLKLPKSDVTIIYELI
jgi:hypothetical protein